MVAIDNKEIKNDVIIPKLESNILVFVQNLLTLELLDVSLILLDIAIQIWNIELRVKLIVGIKKTITRRVKRTDANLFCVS